MTTLLRKEITSLVVVRRMIKPVLAIDEASLLRLEVLAELHTLCQFEQGLQAHLATRSWPDNPVWWMN